MAILIKIQAISPQLTLAKKLLLMIEKLLVQALDQVNMRYLYWGGSIFNKL